MKNSMKEFLHFYFKSFKRISGNNVFGDSSENNFFKICNVFYSTIVLTISNGS